MDKINDPQPTIETKKNGSSGNCVGTSYKCKLLTLDEGGNGWECLRVADCSTTYS